MMTEDGHHHGRICPDRKKRLVKGGVSPFDRTAANGIGSSSRPIFKACTEADASFRRESGWGRAGFFLGAIGQPRLGYTR